MKRAMAVLIPVPCNTWVYRNISPILRELWEEHMALGGLTCSRCFDSCCILQVCFSTFTTFKDGTLETATAPQNCVRHNLACLAMLGRKIYIKIDMHASR